jgi:hypothetical protein
VPATFSVPVPIGGLGGGGLGFKYGHFDLGGHELHKDGERAGCGCGGRGGRG